MSLAKTPTKVKKTKSRKPKKIPVNATKPLRVKSKSRNSKPPKTCRKPKAKVKTPRWKPSPSTPMTSLTIRKSMTIRMAKNPTVRNCPSPTTRRRISTRSMPIRSMKWSVQTTSVMRKNLPVFALISTSSSQACRASSPDLQIACNVA